MDYINSHFKEPLPIANIAKECGMSEYHFYRLFKAVFGLSPHQLIINNRLTLAKHLIVKQHASMSEAALQSGFIDIHSFSKSFKRKFGSPPSTLVS